MQKKILFCLFYLIYFNLRAQVIISSGFFTYTQTFGSSGPGSWTDNVSYLGWYQSSSSSYQGYINITASPPSNNGGVYTYQCASNGNVKLGSRASGGSGTIRYGVRLRNTSGATIQSIKVAYDFFQLSLAQNGGNVNTISFDYQVAASLTSLTTGVWTSVAALNFSALQSTVTLGGSQILGYPCTQTGTRSAVCIPVSIPNNSEIMLRFSDVDDSGNDHHLAIDNLVVNTFTNNICSPLPVTLLSFDVQKAENNSRFVNWITASERQAKSFDIEGSANAIDFLNLKTVSAKGESESKTTYSHLLNPNQWMPYTYFRLKQWDQDNSYAYSPIVFVGNTNTHSLQSYFVMSFGETTTTPLLVLKSNATTFYTLKIINTLGQEVLQKTGLFSESGSETVLLTALSKGVYTAHVQQGNESVITQLLIP